jgi:hypothetical protein
MTKKTPKKNVLRELTDAALQKKAEDEALKENVCLQNFYNFMKPIAEKGLSEGDCRKYLSVKALKTLREDGISITDLDEGIANHYKVRW